MATKADVTLKVDALVDSGASTDSRTQLARTLVSGLHAPGDRYSFITHAMGEITRAQQQVLATGSIALWLLALLDMLKAELLHSTNSPI